MAIKSEFSYANALEFANLSNLAYQEEKAFKKSASAMGYKNIKFFNNDGAQAYGMAKDDYVVLAFRGTEPTQFNDIKADLNALPTRAETVSFVHKGFKDEVDKIWPTLHEDIEREADTRTLWFCGHSLGAAMATIMASRCLHNEELNDPVELHTYGSPRVGWRKYVNSLGVTHHRWVNNNDIVTGVPLWIMGYVHHGEKHYINAYGNVRNPSGWQLFKDRLRGMWMGIKKKRIDNFSDHNISDYIKHIDGWKS